MKYEFYVYVAEKVNGEELSKFGMSLKGAIAYYRSLGDLDCYKALGVEEGASAIDLVNNMDMGEGRKDRMSDDYKGTRFANEGLIANNARKIIARELGLKL